MAQQLQQSALGPGEVLIVTGGGLTEVGSAAPQFIEECAQGLDEGLAVQFQCAAAAVTGVGRDQGDAAVDDDQSYRQ